MVVNKISHREILKQHFIDVWYKYYYYFTYIEKESVAVAGKLFLMTAERLAGNE